MGAKRWVYLIGVYLGNELHYVTGIDNATKRAEWEAGKPAKQFNLRIAEDICEGLNMNMIPSVVIKAPTYMEIKNDEVAE